MSKTLSSDELGYGHAHPRGSRRTDRNVLCARARMRRAAGVCDPVRSLAQGASALSRNNRSRLVRLPGDLRAAQGHGDGRARRCGHTRAHHRRASAHRRAAPEFIQASSKLQASSPLRQAPQGGAASEPEESLLGLMGARVGARARAGPAAYSRVRGWSLAAVTPLPPSPRPARRRHTRRSQTTARRHLPIWTCRRVSRRKVIGSQGSACATVAGAGMWRSPHDAPTPASTPAYARAGIVAARGSALRHIAVAL